jgi:hypothetical protein
MVLYNHFTITYAVAILKAMIVYPNLAPNTMLPPLPTVRRRNRDDGR